METVIVLGTWSSGSTALTGYIQRLGAYSCPPHYITTDERTPDSYESMEFIKALASCVDERTLSIKKPSSEFFNFFEKWLPAKQDEARKAGHQAIVLKHPLSAFMIPEIIKTCNPTFVVVTRQFDAIEKTRQRRHWHEGAGSIGAGRIYSTLFSGLIEANQSYFTISFDDFCNSENVRATLRNHLPTPLCSPSPINLEAAEKWIRR